MKQLLVCCFFVTILMQVSLSIGITLSGAYRSIKYIKENCRPEDEDKWSGNVTINAMKIMDASTKLPDLQNEPKFTLVPAATHKSGKEIPLLSATIGVSKVRPSSVLTTPNASGGWLSKLRNRITQRTKSKLSFIKQKVCSFIAEPIVMPDVNLTKVMGFHAFHGSISGIRQLCQKYSFFPITTERRKLKVGFKYQLELEGLHFHYHVIAKYLGVNRTFNWTLSKGSVAQMYLFVGASFPCAVSIENIDLNLDFEGDDGKRKCTGDCKTILSKLKCYLYYSLVQTFGILLESMKTVASKTICLTFNRAGLQEVD